MVCNSQFKNLLLFQLLFVFFISNASADTTVIFEVPDNNISTSKVYEFEKVFLKQYIHPRIRGSVPDLINSASDSEKRYYTFTPKTKQHSKSFPNNSSINQLFINEFAKKKLEAETRLRSTLERESRVTKIYHAKIDQKNTVIKLGVNAPNIDLNFTGVGLDVKAKIKTRGGLERILCGSSATVKAKANITAKGRYNPGSGFASINNIDPNISVDVNCSGIIGKIFDPFYDYLVDYVVDDMVDDAVEPFLESFSVGRLDDLVNQEAIRASQVLGVDFVRDAWEGVKMYVNGLNIEFRIGVDHFGPSRHMLGFAAYQNSPTAIAKKQQARTYLNIDAEFRCPSWAKNLQIYESIAIPEIKYSGRSRTTVYNKLRFKKSNNYGNYYKKNMASSRYRKFTPSIIIGSCESPSGVQSFQRALYYRGK